MKKFKVPEMKVVYFGKEDIVTASCGCVDCPECPEGKNDCPCVDSWTSDYKPGD